jgi:hypothetical protein
MGQVIAELPRSMWHFRDGVVKNRALERFAIARRGAGTAASCGRAFSHRRTVWWPSRLPRRAATSSSTATGAAPSPMSRSSSCGRTAPGTPQAHRGHGVPRPRTSRPSRRRAAGIDPRRRPRHVERWHHRKRRGRGRSRFEQAPQSASITEGAAYHWVIARAARCPARRSLPAASASSTASRATVRRPAP